MSARATKNMWVERCSHIGALVGGLISLVLGWIPKFGRLIWDYLFSIFLILCLIVFFGCIGFTMYTALTEDKSASVSSIKELINGEHRECVNDYLPKYVEFISRRTSGVALTNKDIRVIKRNCKNAIELEDQRQVLQEQLKATK